MKTTAISFIYFTVFVNAAIADEYTVCPTCKSSPEISIPHCGEHTETLPLDSFQADKAQRVKDAIEQNKGEISHDDPVPPADFVELLICVSKDADENLVLRKINSMKGKVIERCIEYIPGLIKVKVLNIDKDIFIKDLSSDRSIIYVEKVGYYTLD